MTDGSGADPDLGPDDGSPLLPSIDLVRAEVDVERASNERRSDSVDTKAGLILGAAGILIGVGTSGPAVLAVVAQVVAAGSAGWAIAAFVPRTGGALSPRTLREQFITTEERVTKLVVLDTRIEMQEQDEKRLKSKFKRLRWAIALLAASGLLVLAGRILSVLG